MNKYEITVIIKPNLDEEALNAELEKVQALITRFGGTIDKIDNWGRRRMAYEIDDFTDGVYSIIYFSGDSELPNMIEQRIRIFEEVIRYLIIRVEE